MLVFRERTHEHLVYSRNQFCSKSRVLLILACTIMYATSTTHWALTVNFLFGNPYGSETLEDVAADCMCN